MKEKVSSKYEILRVIFIKNLSNRYNQRMLSKEKLMIDLVKWVRSQNAAKKAHSITSILNNLKSLIKQVYQKGCTKKFLKRLSKFDILGVAQL